MEGGGGGMAVVERMRGMLDELARELTSQTPSENPTRVSELEAEVAALRSQHTTLTHTAHQAEVRAAQRESELRDQIKKLQGQVRHWRRKHVDLEAAHVEQARVFREAGQRLDETLVALGAKAPSTPARPYPRRTRKVTAQTGTVSPGDLTASPEETESEQGESDGAGEAAVEEVEWDDAAGPAVGGAPPTDPRKTTTGGGWIRTRQSSSTKGKRGGRAGKGSRKNRGDGFQTTIVQSTSPTAAASPGRASPLKITHDRASGSPRKGSIQLKKPKRADARRRVKTIALCTSSSSSNTAATAAAAAAATTATQRHIGEEATNEADQAESTRGEPAVILVEETQIGPGDLDEDDGSLSDSDADKVAAAQRRPVVVEETQFVHRGGVEETQFVNGEAAVAELQTDRGTDRTDGVSPKRTADAMVASTEADRPLGVGAQLEDAEGDDDFPSTPESQAKSVCLIDDGSQTQAMWAAPASPSVRSTRRSGSSGRKRPKRTHKGEGPAPALDFEAAEDRELLQQPHTLLHRPNQQFDVSATTAPTPGAEPNLTSTHPRARRVTFDPADDELPRAVRAAAQPSVGAGNARAPPADEPVLDVQDDDESERMPLDGGAGDAQVANHGGRGGGSGGRGQMDRDRRPGKTSAASIPSDVDPLRPWKKRETGPSYAYDLGTVRGKEARQRLVAQACPTCFKYFSAFGESDEEVFRKIQETCRHRSTAVNAGVAPPENAKFWEVDFPATQDDTQQKHLLRSPRSERNRRRTKEFEDDGESASGPPPDPGSLDTMTMTHAPTTCETSWLSTR